MLTWNGGVGRWLSQALRARSFWRGSAKRARRRGANSIAGFEQLESRQVPTVTFHGGQLLAHVEAQAVYLGSDWSTNSSLTSQTAALFSRSMRVTDGAAWSMDVKEFGWG